MYLGKEALPMFIGGHYPERVTGQVPYGYTTDINLKCNKACCCLFSLKLAMAGPTRDLQEIHVTRFAKVLKFKSHRLEVYYLLEDLMRTFHLALISSGLPGCSGQRVDEVATCGCEVISQTGLGGGLGRGASSWAEKAGWRLGTLDLGMGDLEIFTSKL